MDAINAVDSVTFEMDQKRARNIIKRSISSLMMQEEDLTVDGAMTDPKATGTASHKQAIPIFSCALREESGRHCRTRCQKRTRPGQLTLDSGHAYHDMPKRTAD